MLKQDTQILVHDFVDPIIKSRNWKKWLGED